MIRITCINFYLLTGRECFAPIGWADQGTSGFARSFLCVRGRGPIPRTSAESLYGMRPPSWPRATGHRVGGGPTNSASATFQQPQRGAVQGSDNPIECQFCVSIGIVRDDAVGPIVGTRDRIGQMPKVGQVRNDIDIGQQHAGPWLALTKNGGGHSPPSICSRRVSAVNPRVAGFDVQIDPRLSRPVPAGVGADHLLKVVICHVRRTSPARSRRSRPTRPHCRPRP